MNETIVVENGQAAVATTSVSGTLSPASSATDTIAIVDTPSGKQAALKVYDLNGGGGGGGATSASQVSMTPLSVINASDVQAGMQIVDNELTGLQGQIGDIATVLNTINGEDI